jgi:quinol monooxygenase YgiN
MSAQVATLESSQSIGFQLSTEEEQDGGSHNQRRRDYVNKVGILATLQARPGKEADVEQFLRSASPLVEAETGTTAWFAFKVAPATFGIFDTFKDEDGRSAHVNGEVAKALFARAEELFVAHPDIKPLDILGEKL